MYVLKGRMQLKSHHVRQLCNLIIVTELWLGQLRVIQYNKHNITIHLNTQPCDWLDSLCTQW